MQRSKDQEFKSKSSSTTKTFDNGIKSENKNFITEDNLVRMLLSTNAQKSDSLIFLQT